MEWGPDGEKLLTATTAPRLRIGNGFKVWHYSGALLHETVWPTGQELLQVIWQKYADGVFTEKPISNIKVTGIQPSQPQSSKAVYVPPNIRSGGSTILPVGASPRSNQPPVERGPIPGLPVGYKVSQGQRKKERNAKRKENENPKQNNVSNSSENSNTTNEGGNASQATQNQATPRSNDKRNPRRTPRQPNNQNHTSNGPNTQNNSDFTSTPNADANVNSANEEQSSANGAEAQKRERKPRNRQRKPEGGVGGTSGDPEKEKRIRTVQQKLRDIAKLKVRRDNGDNLEVNQLSKIGLEADLIKELNSLKVEA